MSLSNRSSSSSSALLGAAFLMATSAIGPGFITQTTVFTEQLKTSFGFVILCSIILDIIIQLNLWRIVAVSGLRAQDLANQALPGSGYFLAALIVVGGLAFNIGNVAGAGLGFQVITQLDLSIGVVVSVAIALGIFLYREAGRALDLFTKGLGMLMMALIAYVVWASKPPVIKAVQHTFLPETISTTAIMVLVGGTVGGYISFAGIHRLLDAGIHGPDNVKRVSSSSIRAILLASVMRVLLFLAALGVVVTGSSLDSSNPAASVFQLAAGKTGYLIFGIVLWCAAITSVVGAAYTSVSFLRTFHPLAEQYHRFIISIFILISGAVFLITGRPVTILIVVGALNACILPLALGVMLLASRHNKLMQGYRHPAWMKFAGWIAVLLLSVMTIKTLAVDLAALWRK